jgi:hypothetical protein
MTTASKNVHENTFATGNSKIARQFFCPGFEGRAGSPQASLHKWQEEKTA